MQRVYRLHDTMSLCQLLHYLCLHINFTQIGSICKQFLLDEVVSCFILDSIVLISYGYCSHHNREGSHYIKKIKSDNLPDFLYVNMSLLLITAVDFDCSCSYLVLAILLHAVINNHVKCNLCDFTRTSKKNTI